MAKRARKASIKTTRRLNQKIDSSETTSTNERQTDEFYARFLNDNPERKLTYSEILEIYEHSLEKLDALVQRTGLR